MTGTLGGEYIPTSIKEEEDAIFKKMAEQEAEGVS